MLKKIAPFFLLATFLWGFQSCNPDCETLSTSNLSVPPGPYQEGTELPIFANPPSAIEGRKIFISFRSSGSSSEFAELPSRFEEGLGAAVVEIPGEANPDISLLVEDPDCGNLVPIGTTTSVEEGGFFIDNPFFVTPTPPLIIIPSPPVAPPPAVVNAWFSPNDRNYCIWFEPDTVLLDNGDVEELPTLVPHPFGIKNVGGSIELAVGCDGTEAADRYYHRNPVSGVVDKERNIIKISIDRTSKGLGTEEFEGQFINPDMLPPGYNIGGVCSPDGSAQPNIMFLTSLQTGRQLILFRQGD